MKTLIVVLLLAGCTSTGGPLSLEYCSNVNYARADNHIMISATCDLPVQAVALPVNPAALVKP